MISIWRRELQQLRQGDGTGLMHRGTDRRLDALQIDPSSRLAITEDDAKQFLYFTCDFELDDLRRFFSWSVCWLCSTGRKRQILRLTSTKSFDSP
jgi:hypothetical protein